MSEERINKRILLVDDEAVIRKLCVRLLTGPGREITPAENVSEALKAIKLIDFDLLVTDLRLPDGNGTDIIIQFHGKFPNKKSIIITGSLTPDERLKELEDCNVSKCLLKPFNPPELAALVQEEIGDTNYEEENSNRR